MTNECMICGLHRFVKPDEDRARNSAISKNPRITIAAKSALSSARDEPGPRRAAAIHALGGEQVGSIRGGLDVPEIPAHHGDEAALRSRGAASPTDRPSAERHRSRTPRAPGTSRPLARHVEFDVRILRPPFACVCRGCGLRLSQPDALSRAAARVTSP